MKALILAAGLGTRLHPLTADRPKPMLPIAGRPLLEHTIGLLRAHGVVDIAMNVHRLPQSIIGHFGRGNRFGVHLTYSYEPQLLGTAGAAKRLEGFFTEPFLVIYGDVLTDMDLGDLARWHCQQGSKLTVAAYTVEDPTRAGILDIDAVGRVRRFIEKPHAGEVFSDLASTGILVVEPDVLEQMQPGVPTDFGTDVIPSLLRAGLPVYGRLADGYVLDIGGPSRYQQALDDAEAGRVRMFGGADQPSPAPAPESILVGGRRSC